MQCSKTFKVRMAKLVDALASDASDESHGSSSLLSGILYKLFFSLVIQTNFI